MDIQKVKHDLNGGFEGVIMAMKILESEQVNNDMKSLVTLSLERLQLLKSLSKELITEIEQKDKL